MGAGHKHYDRARLRERFGAPSIEDAEEWVYVGKFGDTSGMTAGIPLAITATLDDPVWKTIVVTFSQGGLVEKVTIGSVSSAIADRQRRGIILGTYYDREGRMRAATQPMDNPGKEAR
jgi:hypothetical protein